MSVKFRLAAFVAISVATLVALIGVALFAMNRLASLQDDGFAKTQSQAHAAEAASLGAQLYQVFADAIINRNLDDARKEFAERRTEALNDLAQLEREADSPNERQAIAEARKSVEKVVELFEKRLLPKLGAESELPADIHAIDDEADAAVQRVHDELAKVADSMGREAKQADEEFDAARTKTLLTVIVISLLGALGLFVYSLFVVRSIVRPLAAAQAVARRIAAGDLNRDVEVRGSDEFAELLRSCAAMQNSLREIAGSLQTHSDQLAAMSQQLSATTTELATSTEMQSQAASSMAASVEEMSVSIAQVSDHAKEVRVAAAESGRHAAHGQTTMTAMLDNSRVTAAAVDRTAGQIRELGGLSNGISSIVGVIREIADQTNLLALNAAIEAARAGEQGRGFAVVADEVRKLAERTSGSTQEITGMIGQVQSVTQGAVASMEQVVTQIGNFNALSRDVGDAIDAVNAQSGNVMSAIVDITSALHEQSVASNEIARRVEQTAQMSEENSAAVKETSSAAQQLESVASQLQVTAGRFHLA
ncbi:MAG TPA: methyl-accepting chemotaxis protein [Aromatoleum sp.]|uniref:methyl-accepting chemotaxis protein n=1 Tax=Aromatoleum sp. TaxID=2307007 RepID=UPI002B4A257C|nr:methyl-accepting chemotaxis protein [Aromatoleum sp.]HJV28027.1 methyl-accepting chemotaxis protein [Aromatoleum sp.]